MKSTRIILLLVISTLSLLLTLVLLGSDESLALVLQLTADLTGSTGGSLSELVTNEAELGLVLKSILEGVVDGSEASGLLTTESDLETENEDSLIVSDLVLLSESGTDVLLGDGSQLGVENIQHLKNQSKS